jgi:hypothetical protein
VITAGWGAFILAALRALPSLISLMSAMKNSADAAANRGIGYDRAVAESLKVSTERIAAAHAVEQAAAKDHAARTDDSAFDQEFKR